MYVTLNDGQLIDICGGWVPAGQYRAYAANIGELVLVDLVSKKGFLVLSPCVEC